MKNQQIFDKNTHVLDLLDAKSFVDLSVGELKTVNSHCEICAECARAASAAKVSALLLRADVQENLAAVPPFFQAKILANLRGKQAKSNAFAAFWNLWKASKILVAAMSAAVAVLILLTIFAPQFNQNSNTISANGAAADAFDDYSTEMVILNERIPANEPTNEQIFQAVYAAEK